ncbi:glyoxalase [Geomonas limicola]|uniref:Glyoxalase n=1 Tax=Geomonas limicola TaxID=2740186 RepID=A0A6V8NCB5_9BACT|nr:VOC family protein [Geomonas limicola]GFO70176.1 glyoxalase [Geomonas limicola]
MAGILRSIQLSVADLDTTEAFYGGILDLPVQRALTSFGAPEHLLLSVGEAKIIFVEQEEVSRRHPILGARLQAFPVGVGMTLHFEVEGIEDIYQELLEEELEVLYPPELKPYGTRELWCFDPDGYLVVLEEAV